MEEPPEPELHALYKIAPNFTLMEKDANGKVMKSSAKLYKGDIVILYFSAEWCPPCRQFTPMLSTFYKALPKGSVKIVFISRDKSYGEFEGYFSGHHGPYYAMDFQTS